MNMAYEKGDLKLCVEDEFNYNVSPGEYYFEHSCDEWNIGSKENLIKLKEDIEEFLKISSSMIKSEG